MHIPQSGVNDLNTFQGIYFRAEKSEFKLVTILKSSGSQPS